MSGSKPYPVELRRQAVRMVAEVRPNYESDWAAMKAVAARSWGSEHGDGAELGAPGAGR